jgi:AAT family amino acid transporter/D-serine/D-alanine/glycine transporter
VIYRILIFYIGALIVIMSLIPWNQLDPKISPFVVVFDRIGIPAATSIVTLVVISAAMSSCNSGIYSTGRMLYALAQSGRASKRLGVLNRRHLPSNAISLSAALMLFGVFLNYAVPDQVFIWVTSVSLIGTLWTWAIIMLAHRNYRKAVADGLVRAVSYRMPGAPIANWLVLGFLAFVSVLLAMDPATRVALYVAPIWFGIVGLAYYRLRTGSLPAPTQSSEHASQRSPS